MSSLSLHLPQTTMLPTHLVRFMAFDFGTQRTGVAVGNRTFATVQPQDSIQVQGNIKFMHIAQHLKEWQPDALVVGVPYHPDGAAHENTLRAQKFARQLQGRFGLPVYQVDERYTTTQALSSGARDVDAVAACIILEQFFRGVV